MSDAPGRTSGRSGGCQRGVAHAPSPLALRLLRQRHRPHEEVRGGGYDRGGNADVVSEFLRAAEPSARWCFQAGIPERDHGVGEHASPGGVHGKVRRRQGGIPTTAAILISEGQHSSRPRVAPCVAPRRVESGVAASTPVDQRQDHLEVSPVRTAALPNRLKGSQST